MFTPKSLSVTTAAPLLVLPDETPIYFWMLPYMFLTNDDGAEQWCY